MLLIQQSPSFRIWTSRALMLYFRRALLFLVVSSQQRVYYSDAEDDEEIVMSDKQSLDSQHNLNRMEINQSKQNLLKEYVVKKLSEGVNNSMAKSNKSSLNVTSTSISSQIIESPPTELSTYNLFSINDTEINKNQISDGLDYQLPSGQQTPINSHDQIYTPQPLRSHFNYTTPYPCYPPSICASSNDKTSSPESNDLSQPSNDEDNIYEKYQTSFSHILHQTKSLHTVHNEDKIRSRLLFEPNTSIVTVRLLTYHSLHPQYINTSNIRVQLIANRTDLSIQCDTKPIGCRKTNTNDKSTFDNIIKSTPINREQEEKSNSKQSSIISNQRFEATSILVDIPYKMLYIDS